MDPVRHSEVYARITPFSEVIHRSSSTLDEQLLMLSESLQPGLDVIGSMAALDRLAGDCPTPTRDGVVRYLFEGGMFAGDRRSYHRWQNSCLDRVVAERRGMPITLSAVAIEVARRVGVHLVGVGLPGHFIVGDADDRGWFADPFGGRTDLDAADCRRLVASIGGRWSDRFLEPTTNRLIVARVTNNLKATCEQSSDLIRLAIVMQLRQEFPEFASEAESAAASLAIFN